MNLSSQIVDDKKMTSPSGYDLQPVTFSYWMTLFEYCCKALEKNIVYEN